LYGWGEFHGYKERTKMTSTSTLARVARLGNARKRGVTLIEAVLYISIALALIVGGLVFFQQASLAQRVNSAVRNISALASETRGLYQSENVFTGFTGNTLIDAGAAPSSLIVGSGAAATLQNEWGGTIVGAPAQVQAADDSFTITYNSVPRAACVRLANYDSEGSGRVGSGIVSVGFRQGGSAAATAYSKAAITTPAAADNLNGITPTEAGAYCTANATNNGTADMQFTFSR
jgi:hypothetical protein